MALAVGKIYEGKIVNITNFGAFVDIDGEVGLVHISEVSSEYVKDIKEYLKQSQDVKVKVLSIDDKNKVSLSIKQAEDRVKTFQDTGAARDIRSYNDRKRSTGFEDILSKYLKDSEERIQDFKKSQDSKYRGYSRKKFS